MKLWALHYHHDNSPSGNVTEWFTRKDVAKQRERELSRENADGASGFQVFSLTEREVPTKKAALAEWLTRYEP